MLEPFRGDWDDLVQLSARWLSGTTFEEQTKELVQAKINRVKDALIKPYPSWLAEDYFVFVVHTGDGATPSDAQSILQRRGNHMKNPSTFILLPHENGCQFSGIRIRVRTAMNAGFQLFPPSSE